MEFLCPLYRGKGYFLKWIEYKACTQSSLAVIVEKNTGFALKVSLRMKLSYLADICEKVLIVSTG